MVISATCSVLLCGSWCFSNIGILEELVVFLLQIFALSKKIDSKVIPVLSRVIRTQIIVFEKVTPHPVDDEDAYEMYLCTAKLMLFTETILKWKISPHRFFFNAKFHNWFYLNRILHCMSSARQISQIGSLFTLFRLLRFMVWMNFVF